MPLNDVRGTCMLAHLLLRKIDIKVIYKTFILVIHNTHCMFTIMFVNSNTYINEKNHKRLDRQY